MGTGVNSGAIKSLRSGTLVSSNPLAHPGSRPYLAPLPNIFLHPPAKQSYPSLHAPGSFHDKRV